jgi:hypothetical protein
MVFHILKNLLWQRAANFLCTHSSLLESAILTELQATEAYSSLDLTKEKYTCISRLTMEEKENVSVRINPNNNNNKPNHACICARMCVCVCVCERG